VQKLAQVANAHSYRTQTNRKTDHLDDRPNVLSQQMRRHVTGDPPAVMHIVGALEGGGAERWVRDLAPRLQSRGIRTEIVSIYPPRLDAAQMLELGCAVHHRPKRRGIDPQHFAWLYQLIRRRTPNIVHTHMTAGKYVGRAAAILARTPLIVHTEHSPNPLLGREHFLANILSRGTHIVIAFDEHKAELIRKRERVSTFEIIRNGLPLSPAPTETERLAARYRLNASDETVIFGVVASLQERKNPRLALRGFAAMADDCKIRARLDFFGQGPLRDELIGLARDLGILERVRFHGFRSDVREFLAGLDVFLTVATHEMAPISMLEAMVAQLPIIGTPHPGTIEMVDDGVNGCVVDWSVADVTAAMTLACTNASWRHTCGAAGRKRVERDYDIENIADQHVALYRRLMNGSTDGVPNIAQTA